jgi:hypothetical protein
MSRGFVGECCESRDRGNAALEDLFVAMPTLALKLSVNSCGLGRGRGRLPDRPRSSLFFFRDRIP